MRNLPFALMLAVATPVVGQPLVSPEVHSDSRVTFRLKAPNAKDVRVRLETVGSKTMQKDAQGVWSFTSDPIAPDIYSYSFSVDGVQMIDPGNPLLKYNLLNTESQVHVPGPATLPWEINDVPHGVVHRHLYHSAILGDERPFLVYTPPGYDPAAAKTYPVLYLLHGYSDAEDAWVSVGRANVILDNRIAQGKAQPMLIVMPLGYGNKQVIAGGWAGLQNKEVWQDNIAKFRDVLLTEILPQVEKNYRVSTDRESRAVAGLSMGGTESLFIGLSALDRFAWIGAFSSGGLDENFERAYPEVKGDLNSKLRLLWIACGQQDGLIGVNKKLIEWLKSKGVKLTWVETPGGHSFLVWRRYLAALSPLLFGDVHREPAVSVPETGEPKMVNPADWGPAYVKGMELGPADGRFSKAMGTAEQFMAQQLFASQYAKRACVVSGNNTVTDVAFALLSDQTGKTHGIVRVDMKTAECSWVGVEK